MSKYNIILRVDYNEQNVDKLLLVYSDTLMLAQLDARDLV